MTLWLGQTAIKSYIEDHNRQLKPFPWAKTADEIIEQVAPIPAPV
jgi:hypothetical protein